MAEVIIPEEELETCVNMILDLLSEKNVQVLVALAAMRVLTERIKNDQGISVTGIIRHDGNMVH